MIRTESKFVHRVYESVTVIKEDEWEESVKTESVLTEAEGSSEKVVVVDDQDAIQAEFQKIKAMTNDSDEGEN